MSWLRNHMRHYVVPGLKAIAQAQRERAKRLEERKKTYLFEPKNFLNYTQRQPPISIEDVKREPVNMRPARGFKQKELAILWAAIKCFDVRIERATVEAVICGQPPIPKRAYNLKNQMVSQQDQIHTIIKRSSKTLKRILKKDPRRRLILPGRDVWLWSVYCHKKGIPHIFDPRISRAVARDTKVLQDITDAWKMDEHTIIFDTGFAGSIFDAITRATGIKGINLMLSTGRKNYKGKMPVSEQLYPNHTSARAKALTIEYLPKYQKTGTVREFNEFKNRAVQYVADADEFIKAAVLTIWMWYHESPKWISHGEHKCKVVDCSCKSCLLWKGGLQVPTKIM